MMNAEDKYKVVIVDDERTAIDALRRELGAYQEFEIKGTANNGAKGKKMIMELRPERYRKAVASIPATPSSSFSSSVSALMPQQGMFMISTVTGFKLLRLEEIGYFEYLKDKRQWQVVLFNQTRLNLKRNTKAEDIIGYSQAFIQISQSAIVNVNYLAMIDGKCCQLYPPFHDKSDLVISRSFLKGLQDRFFVL